MPILELKKRDRSNKFRKVGSIEIKNQTENTADLCFFGDINSESLGEWQKYYPEDKAPSDVQDFLDQLENVSKINVHINSGGGSVFGGIAIYNILLRYDAEITVYVEGLAASIASVIAMAGDKIVIPSNAQMMIHKPSSIAWGDAVPICDTQKRALQRNKLTISLTRKHGKTATSGRNTLILKYRRQTQPQLRRVNISVNTLICRKT